MALRRKVFNLEVWFSSGKWLRLEGATSLLGLGKHTFTIDRAPQFQWIAIL